MYLKRRKKYYSKPLTFSIDFWEKIVKKPTKQYLSIVQDFRLVEKHAKSFEIMGNKYEIPVTLNNIIITLTEWCNM